tara:strand:- start:636 stop:1445 length:810 start_codon:yes stop_codon:yes gene_type:complete
MLIDCVFTASTMHERYISFVPTFIRAWNKLYPKIDIKILLINSYIPKNLEDYSNNIILFDSIRVNETHIMNPSFISQYIRILYPALLKYENGIIITDIDMLPMNSNYYTKNIKDIDADSFIYYRGNVIPGGKEYAMCYNVAKNKIWSDVFNINNINDINKRLIDVYCSCNYGNWNTSKGDGTRQGWSTDQSDLYKYIRKWNDKTNKLVCLNDKDCGFRRIDRGFNGNDNIVISDNIKELFMAGKISDYHAYRPNTEWRKLLNEKIIDLI